MEMGTNEAAEGGLGQAFAKLCRQVYNRELLEAFVLLTHPRAKRVNAKCASKDRAIDDELRRIEQRKVELATMRKMNGRQRNVWLQTLNRDTIIPYSKEWNRRVADKIQSILPSELRRIIYVHLLDEDTWNKYEPNIQWVATGHGHRSGYCAADTGCHHIWNVPHFLCSEYMGNATAFEIVELVYRDEWFQFATLHSMPTHLGKLIHEDSFQAGFDPAPLIRELDIYCHVDWYRLPRDHHRPTGECSHSPYERRYTDQDELKEQFSHLLDIVHNKELRCLKVNFIQRNVRLDVLEEVLEAFTSVYFAFRQAGATMRLDWIYQGVIDTDYEPRMTKNVGKFFILPRSIWKRQMLNFLNKIKPHMEQHHVRFVDEPSLGLSDTAFVHKMWDSDEEEFTDEDVEDSDEETDSELESEGGSDAIYWADGTRYV